jgi:hypothetical protein
MGWRLIDKPKTLKVTKLLAQRFAEMEPAPHDRPLSERRLLVYRRVLKEGGFRPVTWAVANCKETNGTYRVNGKHTSVMLAGVDPLPEFYAVVEEYECDTLEDVAKLYATFDSTTQSRSARDIYLSFAATVTELRDLPAHHISLAVTGMTFHLGNGSSTSVKGVGERAQAADRAELLLEHPDFVVWMSGVLSSGQVANRGRSQSKHLQRQPVAAAMMGSWTRAKGAATEFWEAVRDETGTSPNLPDRKLARYLMTTGVDTGGGGSRRLRPVPPREMYVKCVHAWNAWRKKETTNLNYYPDAEVPSFR